MKKSGAVILLVLLLVTLCFGAQASTSSVDSLFDDLHSAYKQISEGVGVSVSAVDAPEKYYILNTNCYVCIPSGMYRYSESSNEVIWYSIGALGQPKAITFARMTHYQDLTTWKNALDSNGYQTAARLINGIDFVYAAKESTASVAGNRLFDVAFLYNYQGATYAMAATSADHDASMTVGSIVSTITVNCQNVNVNATSLVLYPKQTFTLYASSEGQDVAFGYTSSRKSVASVGTHTGVVTAKKAGTATITVISSKGLYTTVKVTVKSAPSIRNLPSGKRIYIGTPYQLSPYMLLNSKATITKQEFTYSSGKPSVAIVSPDGLVLGLKRGTAYITVKSNAGSSKKIKFTVR